MSNKRMYHYQRKEGVPYYYKSATSVYLIASLFLITYLVYEKAGLIIAAISLLCYPITIFIIFMFIVFPFESLTDLIFRYKKKS